MKKKAIKLLDLNCEWFANNKDAKGNNKGSWTCEAILYDNNLIIGMATDANHNTRTHAIVGCYDEEIGVSLFKLNFKKTSYDPIAFTCTKSNNGKSDTSYGIFTAITPLNQYNLGYAKIKVEDKPLNQAKVTELKNMVKAYESFVYGECYFQYRVYKNFTDSVGENFTQKLRELYEKNKDLVLPEVLREEPGHQADCPKRKGEK